MVVVVGWRSTFAFFVLVAFVVSMEVSAADAFRFGMLKNTVDRSGSSKSAK